MELNRKTTGIIIIAVGVIIGLVFIVSYSMTSTDTEEVQINNVYIEHPDAEVTESATSKIDAYRRDAGSKRSIENYWDSIEDNEHIDDDPMADMTSVGKGSASSSLDALKARSKDTQNLGSRQKTQSSKFSGSVVSGGTQKKTKEERIDDYLAARQQMTDQYLNSIQQASASQANSEPDILEADIADDSVEQETVVIEQPKIKRSGNISTLDDSFGTLTTGISSLDEESDLLDSGSSHPLKCMFTKEEKIENGQRVSIRLLEDMVVGSVLVPKNTHLMAVCTIGNRLMLKVSSIELNGQIYSMNYEAYDNDGAKGIYCPDIDNSAKETAKQSGMSLGRRAFTKTGALVSEVTNLGLTIAELSTSGSKSVKVPSGYTFYLISGTN